MSRREGSFNKYLQRWGLEWTRRVCTVHSTVNLLQDTATNMFPRCWCLLAEVRHGSLKTAPSGRVLLRVPFQSVANAQPREMRHFVAVAKLWMSCVSQSPLTNHSSVNPRTRQGLCKCPDTCRVRVPFPRLLKERKDLEAFFTVFPEIWGS